VIAQTSYKKQRIGFIFSIGYQDGTIPVVIVNDIMSFALNTERSHISLEITNVSYKPWWSFI